MTQIQMLQKELEKEAVTTRKMLERVPEEKFDWKPHPKSGTLKWLATHVAELPGWVEMTLQTSELDFAQNPYKPETINSKDELMAYFDRSLAKGRAALSQATDAQLNDMWTLRSGDQVYSTDSKADVLRMAYCQTVHHRAQLGVYLRLLEVPIPGSYGPSADEMNF
ncbi:MAG TPA: DinB family protein [Chitinophaga sp.]|uniref:DinB family protein n=1 Tax=Chitinophaga sp. TaxID=1869181 RepID=UPI002DB8A25E|nr:DinB family protein [Chitinophaga sp.]HEU4555312.1 DinB family protein [Chitinophaga sp.]